MMNFLEEYFAGIALSAAFYWALLGVTLLRKQSQSIDEPLTYVYYDIMI